MPLSSTKKSEAMGHAAAESEDEKRTTQNTEMSGYPLPSQAFVQKPSRREPNRSLVAALVLAMIAGGGYAAYTMVPAFHTMANANYQLIRSQIPGAKPAATIPPKPALVRVAVKPTPVPVVPPDGFVDVTTANSLTDTATTTSSKPVILATTATTTTAEEPAPISVADELADQHVSTRVDPIYPESLGRKGVHGDVVLQTIVAKDGSVDSVSVISGNPQLAPAAMDAVKQWKYETYVHGGVAVSFQTNVTVEFATPQKSSR
jgi:TonB family protein